MRTARNHFHIVIGTLPLAIICLFLFGCSAPAWHFGVGGKYNEAKTEIARPRKGNIDKAILNLESIVREDPTYRDSLTLLGIAYYKKDRYQDSIQILQRALAVNQEDEIAWLLLGLNQIRLGDSQKGIESLKGGLTLATKAMRDGYRGFSNWDRNGLVRSSLRRSIFLVMKGPEEKENIIRAIEALLLRINDEEWYQTTVDRAMERRERDPGY